MDKKTLNLPEIKFGKNPAYKNINNSQFGKPIINKNTSIMNQCHIS